MGDPRVPAVGEGRGAAGTLGRRGGPGDGSALARIGLVKRVRGLAGWWAGGPWAPSTKPTAPVLGPSCRYIPSRLARGGRVGRYDRAAHPRRGRVKRSRTRMPPSRLTALCPRSLGACRLVRFSRSIDPTGPITIDQPRRTNQPQQQNPTHHHHTTTTTGTSGSGGRKRGLHQISGAPGADADALLPTAGSIASLNVIPRESDVQEDQEHGHPHGGEEEDSYGEEEGAWVVGLWCGV